MRTPGHDCELAAGFLMSEGVICDSADIVRIDYVAADSAPVKGRHREGPATRTTILPYQPALNMVRVELRSDVTISLATLEHNFYTTSSCGICGKASLLALRSVCPPRAANQFSVAAESLYSLPSRLSDSQDVFRRTGGLHASGLFTSSGQLLSSREDVGRPNAVDKLLGTELLADRIPLRDRLLMLSGRASFELLQKALMGGIPMVVPVGAPSSLAVRVAREFDITLVGFLRAEHFNVYHGHRALGIQECGMKLRIKGNSLRFRVTRSELARLLDKGRIEETIHFASDEQSKLTYALEHDSCAVTAGLRYQSREITIVLPTHDAEIWGQSNQVGIYAAVDLGHGVLELIVEKDFACLDLSDADTFANPNAGRCADRFLKGPLTDALAYGQMAW
jgi:FdhD protein